MDTGGVRAMRPYPALALSGLAIASTFVLGTFGVMSPEIARTLGIGIGAIAAIGVLHGVVLALAALPLAEYGRRAGRARLCVAAGLAWAAGAAIAATATAPLGLAAVLAALGVAAATAGVLHPSLVADVYPEHLRVRAFATYRGFEALGLVGGPALIAALVTWGDLTWRGVLLVASGIALVAALAAVRLRDPRPPAADLGDPLRPTSMEVTAALLRDTTLARLLVAAVFLGAMLAPLGTVLAFFLEDRWGLGPAARGVLAATYGGVVLAAVALFARDGERALARGPADALLLMARITPVGLVALVAAVSVPAFGVTVAGLCAFHAVLALLQTYGTATMMTLAPPEARTHAAALLGLAVLAIGGPVGVLLLGGLAEEVGTAWAVAAFAVPGAAAALALRSAANVAEPPSEQGSSDVRVPEGVLAARDLTVAYGHRRAVEGVDLDVGEGEILALLGTNGAGKSSLLRALAGLQPPAAGRVLLGGRDITALAPERRARNGIVFVAGADSVFGPLTVRESLQVAAEAAGAPFAAGRFPALEELLDQPVATLSGGERQMLALAQALLAGPLILLVDELTNGLAPEAVDGLLETLRELQAGGLTLVFVEQSPEIALRVATRAVFLERGRVRFDGPPAALRARSDLLRPVLLAGARLSG